MGLPRAERSDVASATPKAPLRCEWPARTIRSGVPARPPGRPVGLFGRQAVAASSRVVSLLAVVPWWWAQAVASS